MSDLIATAEVLILSWVIGAVVTFLLVAVTDKIGNVIGRLVGSRDQR
jgi:hypothetical protein